MILPEYQVRAVNTATDHENRIHSDEVAARYGFRGGLVPGVNVYGYLTVPVVRHFGNNWLERGWMNVRFREPFYEDEQVMIASAVREDASIALNAGRASAEAGLSARPVPEIPVPHPLPSERRRPTRELIFAGAPLGSFSTELKDWTADPLPCYGSLAHPTVLLGLANDILVRNFVLPAWIHVSSEVSNFRAARRSETVEVRGMVRETFVKKGHEFLVAMVSVLSADGELLMHALHTAIWQPRVS